MSSICWLCLQIPLIISTLGVLFLWGLCRLWTNIWTHPGRPTGSPPPSALPTHTQLSNDSCHVSLHMLTRCATKSRLVYSESDHSLLCENRSLFKCFPGSHLNALVCLCQSVCLCIRQQGCTCAQKCDFVLNRKGADEGEGVWMRHSVVQMLCHHWEMKHLALWWWCVGLGWLVSLIYSLSCKHRVTQADWEVCLS